MIAGVVEIKPGIRGVFNSTGDVFTPGRHRVVMNAEGGKKALEYLKTNATVEKDATILPGPVPVEFFGGASDSSNEIATPAGMALLLGSKLKHNKAAADEGIYFLPLGGGEAVKVTQILDNKPARLSFLVPALTPGDWVLQVRARMKNNDSLRIRQLDAVMTVV